jgi:hypothetical protein
LAIEFRVAMPAEVATVTILKIFPFPLSVTSGVVPLSPVFMVTGPATPAGPSWMWNPVNVVPEGKPR